MTAVKVDNGVKTVLPKIDKTSIVTLSFLTLSALYCIMPLITHIGLPYAHDMLFHLFEADQFDRAIQDGYLYPRWMTGSYNGYGSANFVFYAPLVYYVITAIQFFVPSLIASMIITIWLGFFFSGVTMYFAASKLLGRSGALLSAVIYQILPYHLSDIYVRGALAEFFAFIWFPLIVLFIHESTERGNNGAIVGLSLSYAGLILTHLPSGFIISILIGSYLMYNLFFKERKRVLKPLFSSIAGLGLSSFYLMPVIFERKFVQIDFITKSLIGDYKKNFLFVWDKFQVKLKDFYLPMHIGVILEVILFIIITILLRRDMRMFPNKRQRNFFIVMFLAALFLTTPLSIFVWQMVPGLQTLQFPWRWLTVLELSLCFLVGTVFFAGDMPRLKSANMKNLVICILFMLCVMSFFILTKSKVTSGDFLAQLLARKEITQYMDPPIEYTPIWATKIYKIMADKTFEKVSLRSGRAQYTIDEWKSEKRVIELKADSPSLLKVWLFYYPGWEAMLDGFKTAIEIEKETGAILVMVPAGEHRLVLSLTDTPVRFFSKFLSILSLVTLIFIMIFFRKHKTMVKI